MNIRRFIRKILDIGYYYIVIYQSFKPDCKDYKYKILGIYTDEEKANSYIINIFNTIKSNKKDKDFVSIKECTDSIYNYDGYKVTYTKVRLCKPQTIVWSVARNKLSDKLLKELENEYNIKLEKS